MQRPSESDSDSVSSAGGDAGSDENAALDPELGTRTALDHPKVNFALETPDPDAGTAAAVTRGGAINAGTETPYIIIRAQSMDNLFCVDVDLYA